MHLIHHFCTNRVQFWGWFALRAYSPLSVTKYKNTCFLAVLTVLFLYWQKTDHLHYSCNMYKTSLFSQIGTFQVKPTLHNVSPQFFA